MNLPCLTRQDLGSIFAPWLILWLLPSGATPVLAQRPAVTLERYERWTLYSEFDGVRATKSALLIVYVKNNTHRLVKRWQAILVARDSTGHEMFRVAVEKDSADLEPQETARVELQFENRPEVPGEPYDHLLGNDTTNIHLSFDAVRIPQVGVVRYLRAGAPMCFTVEAYRAVESERYAGKATAVWRAASESAGCQWSEREMAVELIRAEGSRGALARPKRMSQTVWVFTDDLVAR
ncbi:MAG: hypothetical protein GTN62_12035 [Gemmatimonadales bacterium]|nr:hypothetical protein [Gemmatimonadales bacterium]NIN12449.1 hypothetical protein [Gemmatimonadales bacterium]NIN50825.1 hypothetical protein [Gemmatimonadales bacterium]NIP08289.1 hypothetical protein [Gemmatimonadales bacterium]NIR00813.1 hypothetical protein [Gemmatimonadales bacterium]